MAGWPLFMHYVFKKFVMNLADNEIAFLKDMTKTPKNHLCHVDVNKYSMTCNKCQRLAGTIGIGIGCITQTMRSNDHEKIIVISQGMASTDLAIAKFVYDIFKDSDKVQKIVIKGAN